MYNKKKLQFNVEKRKNNVIAIIQKPLNKDWNTTSLCTISEKEIFFGKGVILIKKISNLKEENFFIEKHSYTIYINADDHWNSTMKKKYPIRWYLRLISRSNAYTYCFGIANSKLDEDLLKEYFKNIGINTIYS